MTDKEMIFRALVLWSNYIETGSVNHSIEDAQNVKDVNMAEHIGRLTDDQRQMVKDLRSLMMKVLVEKNYIIT